jgi:hypothetical protein
LLKFAKQITIKQNGSKNFALTIDGEQFPFYIAEGGVQVDIGVPPTVTLMIPADEVYVENRLSPPEAE